MELLNTDTYVYSNNQSGGGGGSCGSSSTTLSEILLLHNYNQYIGKTTRYVKYNIHQWLSMGIDPEVIEYAIEETAAAPRPTLRYMMAIMERCIRDEWSSLNVSMKRYPDLPW